MSFSSNQKNEIMTYKYKSQCCRRALLMGYLFAKADTLDGETVFVKAENDATMSFISRLVKEFYAKELISKHSKSGGRFVYAEFQSSSAAKYLLNLENQGELYVKKCSSCERAFLRGVFFGCGRVTDPEKQYCMEFYLGSRTQVFADYLAKIGIVPSISNKKTGTALYFKDSSKIEDFSVLTKMNTTYYAISDVKIKRQIRNNANRAANFVTSNIKKAVNASGRHLNAINELAEANLLSSLPEELEKTARLRMQYPDYSLLQLSQIIVPPISKSGLAHRLNKIVELSPQLLNKT